MVPCVRLWSGLFVGFVVDGRGFLVVVVVLGMVELALVLGSLVCFG